MQGLINDILTLLCTICLQIVRSLVNKSEPCFIRVYSRVWKQNFHVFAAFPSVRNIDVRGSTNPEDFYMRRSQKY